VSWEFQKLQQKSLPISAVATLADAAAFVEITGTTSPAPTMTFALATLQNCLKQSARHVPKTTCFPSPNPEAFTDS
jgi:hypothetical protein